MRVISLKPNIESSLVKDPNELFNRFFVIGCCGLIAGVIGSIACAPAWLFVLSSLLGIISVFFISNRYLVSPFLLGLSLRIISGLGLYLYSLSIGRHGFFPFTGNDDEMYYLWASGKYNVAPPNFYPVLLKNIFNVTGNSLELGIAINIVIGALTVLLVAKIANYIDCSLKAQQLAAIIAAIYPAHVIYSSFLVRDVLLVATGLIATISGMSCIRLKTLYSYLIFLSLLILFFLFRPYAAIVLFGAWSLVYLLASRIAFYNKILTFMVVIGLYGIATRLVGFGWFGVNYILPKLDTQLITTFRETAYGQGGSSAGISVDFGNPISFIKTLSYSFINVIYAPFIWQVSNMMQALALPESLVFLMSTPFAIKGFLIGVRRNKTNSYIVALFAVLFSLSVAVFSDNIGANTRLRMITYISVIPFVALSLERDNKKDAVVSVDEV